MGSLPRICKTCGASFHAKASLIARTGAPYCCRPCADIGRRKAVPFVCETCGKAFTVAPSALKQEHKGRFCSPTCHGPEVSRVMKGKVVSAETRAKLSAARLGKRVKPVMMLDCRQCGVSFEGPRQLSIADRAKAKFCSYDCSWEHRRTHPEMYPTWRGGYDPYYGPNWKHQAKLARERDNDTCQGCGKEQHRPLLPVHHIRRLRVFNRDFVAANDLTNLVTLCATCHMRRERALDRSAR